MVRETFNNQKVRAVVADDHPLFRDGLIRALLASVLGCADSRLAPEIIFDQFVGA
jgi:carbonic anhydrase